MGGMPNYGRTSESLFSRADTEQSATARTHLPIDISRNCKLLNSQWNWINVYAIFNVFSHFWNRRAALCEMFNAVVKSHSSISQM